MIDVSKGEDVRLYKLADLIVRGWNFSFPISTLDFIGWYYAYPCNLFGLQCFAQLSTPFSTHYEPTLKELHIRAG